MIFLLNREYILWEAVELARLQMCEVLRIPTAAIEARLELNSGKIEPEFRIDAEACEGVSKDDIRQVMQRVYEDCKIELVSRLKGADYTRQQYLERFVYGKEVEKEEVEEAVTS